MNSSVTLENQIQEEVARLRAQFSQTRDLYREVCALLFFRYGITPTTNKLYQFVRKGSMSVPTEVLSDFWKELREKGMVQIMQPDLPDDLCDMAGKVMSTIWTKAQLSAHESLVNLRNEIEEKVLKIQEECNAFKKSRDDFALKLQASEEKALNQFQTINGLKQSLADSGKENDMFRQQLKQKETALDDLRQAMEGSEISFKVEIERLQTFINDIQERGRNEISQALTELNSSKARINRLEVELMTAQSANKNLQAQYRTDTDLLKAQIGDLREKVGDLNGRLEITKATNEDINTQINSKEKKLKEVLAQLDLAKKQAKPWPTKNRQRKIKRLIN
jgi:DNA repair exonuclease SbcCD ATPase subunit